MESLHNPQPITEVEPYVYKILTPEPHHTQLRTNEELHEKYLWMLSGLIEETVGDPETRSDTLVFLDKSARPLAWMMRTFWEDLAPQERDAQGVLHTIPMPDMKFINIDRLEWRADPQMEMTDGGMKELTPSDIAGLRDIFNLGKRNLMDGKRVTVIDEQSESGDTLKVAEELFRQAFPTAEIKATTWINHPVTRDSRTSTKSYEIKEIPVWYPLKGTDKLSEEERGRGVFSPDTYHMRSESFRKRFGADSNKYLTSRPRLRRQLSEQDTTSIETVNEAYNAATDPAEKERLQHKLDSMYYTSIDQKSKQLRQDIGRMLVDFWNGKIIPSIVTDRETIRGMPANEYYKLRQDKARSAQRAS